MESYILFVLCVWRISFNITFSIVSFINLIYVLGLIILKQSNVTHQIQPIISIVFYVLLLLFSITILFVDLDEQKLETKHKKNVVCVASIFLVTMLIGYTIVSNFMAFNLVSAKIYKDQFMDMVENNLNIPIVEVTTQDNVLPYSKEEYVNCLKALLENNGQKVRLPEKELQKRVDNVDNH